MSFVGLSIAGSTALGSMAVGAGLGAGAYGLASAFGNSKPKVNPYGALNPQQIALTQQLGPDYQSMLNNGPGGFMYNGQLTAPITQNMQDVVNQSQQNYGQANQMYSNLMNQANPNQLNQWYDQYVQGPEQQNFASNVAPYIREQAPGFGTQGMGAIGQAEIGLQSQLSAGRLAALQQGQQVGMQAAGQQAGQTQSNMDIQQIPYEIQQAGLTNEYNNYQNSSQEYMSALNDMNNFLGISTGTTTMNPNPMMTGLTMAGQAANIYSGLSGTNSANNANNALANYYNGLGSNNTSANSSNYSLQGSPMYASALSGNYSMMNPQENQ